MIDLISTNFVPVAVNLYDLREAKGEDADFYRGLHRQKEQWQGFWIVSPKGKVLAAHHEFKTEEPNWPDEVLRLLRRTIADHGPFQPRRVEPRPLWVNRGFGVREDGSVTLDIFIRHLTDGKIITPVVFDSLTLSARELDDFLAPEPTQGATWRPPLRTFRKLVRCLSPNTDLVWMANPDEVTDFQFEGTVHDVRDQTVVITYLGRMAMKHDHPFEKGKFCWGKANIRGVGVYDLKTNKMQAVALLFEGVFHDFQPYHKHVTPTVAGVYWQLPRD